MIIYPRPYIWGRDKPRPPRKQKQLQIRAIRTLLDMRKRERVFPPGPYRDAKGNMKFLGRAKPC